MQSKAAQVLTMPDSSFWQVSCTTRSRSAGCTAEFENIVVVASKNGPVETGPTVLVATALLCTCGGVICTVCNNGDTYNTCTKRVVEVVQTERKEKLKTKDSI